MLQTTTTVCLSYVIFAIFSPKKKKKAYQDQVDYQR